MWNGGWVPTLINLIANLQTNNKQLVMLFVVEHIENQYAIWHYIWNISLDNQYISFIPVINRMCSRTCYPPDIIFRSDPGLVSAVCVLPWWRTQEAPVLWFTRNLHRSFSKLHTMPPLAGNKHTCRTVGFPWIFPRAHWLSIGLPEISRVTSTGMYMLACLNLSDQLYPGHTRSHIRAVQEICEICLLATSVCC